MIDEILEKIRLTNFLFLVNNDVIKNLDFKRTFLTKLLHEVNLILKYLCKFQNEILISARGLQIQKISTDLCCGSHFDRQG